jgi:hypothetical protein
VDIFGFFFLVLEAKYFLQVNVFAFSIFLPPGVDVFCLFRICLLQFDDLVVDELLFVGLFVFTLQIGLNVKRRSLLLHSGHVVLHINFVVSKRVQIYFCFFNNFTFLIFIPIFILYLLFNRL